MPNVRLLVLVGYFVAVVLLQRHLLHHPPEPSKTFVEYFTRCIYIILALAMPLIGPLIAYLWVDFYPLPLVFVVLFAIILPVGLLYLPWLWLMEVPKHRLFILLIALIIVLILMGILLWIFAFNKGNGITWALLPLLFFILVPPAFMLAVLYHWAPEVLPLSPEERRRSHLQATRLLTGFLSTFPRPTIMVEHGELQTRISGNPFTGTGPGLLVTEPHNAVALYQGTIIKDIIGPGVFFTGRSEIPTAVMDLQGQFRVTPGVEAQTRDNIRVRVPCSSIFRLEGSREPSAPGELWQYNKEAAQQAYLASEVNPAKQPTKLEAHRAHNWADLPLQEAAHRIQHVLKRYALDEIYAISDPQPDELPRLTIARDVREHVKTHMAAIGIAVTGGGVGNRIAPTDPKVVQQRSESWKAHKMQTIERDLGLGKAAAILEQNRVRSEVLVELVETLRKQIALLEKAGPQAAKGLIALRLLQTLDDIAQQPEVKAKLTKPTAETLTTLHRRASQS